MIERIQIGAMIAILSVGKMQLLAGLSLTTICAVFSSKGDGIGAPCWGCIPVISFISSFNSNSTSRALTGFTPVIYRTCEFSLSFI